MERKVSTIRARQSIQPSSGHSFSQLAGQGMYLVEGGGPLLKHGLEQLAGPVRGLPKLQH